MPAAPVSRNRIPIRTRASQFGVRHPECTLLYQTIAELLSGVRHLRAAYGGDGGAPQRSRLPPPSDSPVGAVSTQAAARPHAARRVLNMVLRIFLRVIARSLQATATVRRMWRGPPCALALWHSSVDLAPACTGMGMCNFMCAWSMACLRKSQATLMPNLQRRVSSITLPTA